MYELTKSKLISKQKVILSWVKTNIILLECLPIVDITELDSRAVEFVAGLQLEEPGDVPHTRQHEGGEDVATTGQPDRPEESNLLRPNSSSSIGNLI